MKHAADNLAFRKLFTLPPVRTSASTALIVSETPSPKVITGHRELDAVLWLRECISTGQPPLIAMALDSFKAIKTPAKDLERRYCDYLRDAKGGSPFAAIFGGFGFADLEGYAKTSIEKKARRDEAIARFGTTGELFKLTPAEERCKKALRGLKPGKGWGVYDPNEADARFEKLPDLVPHTLADCLHEQNYWRKLYWFRNEFDMHGSDAHPAGSAHEDFCFAAQAKIPPRSKDEALQVYQHLEDNDGLDRNESPAILRNLIVGGWK